MNIFVLVETREGESQRLELARPEITIGRVQGNDIVLPKGNVSKRHCRVVIKDGKMIIVDLRSSNGTYVNGRRITSPLVIKDSDKIYVGDFKLTFSTEDWFVLEADTNEVDVTELRLLANIAQREDGSRMVYADWLEEHGDPRRAEFLRLQEIVPTLADGSHFHQVSQRMRELATDIDISWRRKVARPLIERCLGLEVECPKDWGSLSATEQAGVRYCEGCRKKVYYCASVGEARSYAERGECVAVDVVAIRRPNDLERERPIRMGMVMPYDPE